MSAVMVSKMYLWLVYLLWTTCALSDLTPSETQLPVIGPNPVEFVGIDDLIGSSIVEGDILTLGFEEDSRNAVRQKKYLWENGTIPYVWGDEFYDDEKERIIRAMSLLESQTCIRFVEKTEENSFIRFQKKRKGCYAAIGRLRGLEGPLPVNLQTPECLRVLGTVQHELLHVIGLHHEQSRPDRDDFVTIHWKNVNPQKKSDFRKRTEEQVTTFGLPYDYGSVMHYSNYAFSKNGKPTITAKGDPYVFIGQREAPSAGDIEKVRRMYNCNMTETNAGTEESVGESIYL